MRIMIIGSGGAGKSTFSKGIGEALDIPIYHLDAYYWRSGWVPTPDEEWDEFIRELIKLDNWIIDGNYSRTFDLRMKLADVIIYLDINPLIATYRVVKRRLQYHGKTRPDLSQNCPEKLDWEFIQWVWTFRRRKRTKILEKLQHYSKGSKIFIIKKPKEVKKLLEKIKIKGISVFQEG